MTFDELDGALRRYYTADEIAEVCYADRDVLTPFRAGVTPHPHVINTLGRLLDVCERLERTGLEPAEVRDQLAAHPLSEILRRADATRAFTKRLFA